MSNSLEMWVVNENAAEEYMRMPRFRVDVSLSRIFSSKLSSDR